MINQKEYFKEYSQRPGVKEKIRKYKREYMQIPEAKVRRQKYLKEYRIKNKIILREKIRNYKQKNKEKISKQNKEYSQRPESIKIKQEWFKKNEKRIKEKRKKYYEKNKERINRRRKEYYSIPKNKQKLKHSQRKYEQRLGIIQMRKDFEKNPIRKEQHKISNRIWHRRKREEDPFFKLITNLRSRLRMALKQYTKNGKIRKAQEYGINYKSILENLKPFPKDLSKFEVDHIIPLSWFDFNNPKEIEWAFAPENHQWLTKEENRIKSNNYILIK